MLQNLDILNTSEQGMEEVLIKLWCPVCKYPMFQNKDDYGDTKWFCMKCNRKFFRYGFNGPLCESMGR